MNALIPPGKDPVRVAPDPFAPLTDADRAAAAALPCGIGDTGDDTGTIDMLPCPEQDPPAHCFRHWIHGEPVRVWLYRDGSGALICAVARYDLRNEDGSPKLKANGKQDKVVLPWCYGRRQWTDRSGKAHDRTDWHAKAPPAPRPLYGLDRLAARPTAPVLVCEGEKAADAAAVRFPDYVAVAAMGGARAPHKADWSPLQDRDVTIWPDNDEPGAQYANIVADLAMQAGAQVLRIIDVPTEWPPGWDLAEDLPDGVTPDQLRSMLDGAPEEAAVTLPPGFRLTRKGLFFLPSPTDKSPEPAPVFVAAPFQVVGETRSETGEGWGVLLRWRDRDGSPHQWAIPRRLIHRPGHEIAEDLEHAGLSCGSDAAAHQALKRFIGAVEVTRRLRCVTRTGWHSGDTAPVFVLPGGDAFGPGAANMILQADHARANTAYRSAGTLAGWQREVAVLAVGNDRLALVVSAAFAGAILDVTGEPSGGFNLVGGSRIGKSSAAGVAASVWGKPTAEAQMRSWRGTANGLEGTAAETSDTLLVLDEIGQADPREVGDVVYMLANEGGKQRASRTGAARTRHSWRVLFLSTGEITLAQKMGEAGKRATAGLDARLINLPADAGAGLGIFQNLHGRPSPAALAEALRDGARTNHGVAARAFLTRLAYDRAHDEIGLRDTIKTLRDRFLADHLPDAADGQVRNVASRFALVGAAGELARAYGVLPWPEGEAMRAAGAGFEAWLGQRGGAGPAEDAAALAQIRHFIEMHGESRFTPMLASDTLGEPTVPEMTRTINRAGWRRPIPGGGGEEEYLIQPEVWKNDVCRGLDPKRTADLLASRGLLLGGGDRHRADSARISGKVRRVYRVSGAILSGDEVGIDGTG